MTETKTDPLAAFCGVKSADGRWTVSQIWHDGKYRCATDTRIGVVEPCAEPAEVGRFVPLAKIVDEAFAKVGDWEPMPTLPEIELKPCDECKGKGAFKKCDECDGDGEIECFECGHEQDCKECRAEGFIPAANGEEPCERCDGTASVPTVNSHAVMGRMFGPKYLQKIAALPNVEVAISGSMGVIVFRSGSIRGILKEMLV